MSHDVHGASGNPLGEATLALVLAGGKGTRLRGMMDECAKPAIPFGGQHRIVDFTLSNCINSGLRRVALLTQHKAESIMQHLHTDWSEHIGLLDGCLEVWRSQPGSGYLGTADAVYKNLGSIEARDPAYVVILAGDHVYSMDYLPMIEMHAARDADVTVSCIETPIADAHNFGIVELGPDERLERFVEKPSGTERVTALRRSVLASMGVYVFKTRFLLDCLEADARDPQSRHDFGHDIFPRIVSRGCAYAHVFDSTATGTRRSESYWRDVGTIDAYWQAHMDLLGPAPLFSINDPGWPLRSHPRMSRPARLGPSGRLKDTVVSGGCQILGDVEHSVLSTGCRVAAGATVRDSILLPNASVGRDCVLDRVIVDGGCAVPDGTIIARSALDFHVSPNGVTLVSRGALERAADTFASQNAIA